jgi:hypothetical protein
MAVGDSYTQSTGIENSWVKTVRMISEEKRPLIKILKTTKATQRLHQWFYESEGTISSNNKSVEGATTTPSAPTDMTSGTNWCQIVKTSYAVSGTQIATNYNGIKDYLAHQMKLALKRNARDVEYALEVGAGNAGASATEREVKGLSAWCVAQNSYNCTSNAINTSTGEAALNDVMQAIMEDGEEANTVLLSPTNKKYVSAWTNSNTKYQDRSLTKLKNLISVYESDFGTVEFYISTMVGDTNILVFDREAVKIAYLRPTFKQNLAITGDNVPFQIITEMTLEVLNPNATGAVIIN